jgi:cupin fold WbuC family metalloprotein
MIEPTPLGRALRLRDGGPELRHRGHDVWYVGGPLSCLGAVEIAFLKERASSSPRKRARICEHENAEAPVHEMLIAHHHSCYVRPHRHPSKAESFMIFEGEATAVFFDEVGSVKSTLEMRAPPAPTFAYRVAPGTWHSLIIRSEWLIFFEVSRGPFTSGSSEFPVWAPDESKVTEARDFVRDLLERLNRR